MEVEFLGIVIQIALNFKSQETEKIEFLSQGTYGSPNLRFETVDIADYEHVKISIFALLDIR